MDQYSHELQTRILTKPIREGGHKDMINILVEESKVVFEDSKTNLKYDE